MMHYLNKNIFNRVMNLDGKDALYRAWQTVLHDDTLCPVLRNERIDVYYRGFKAFSLTDGGIFRNPDTFENDLCVFDVPGETSDEQFLHYLPYMKQNIDLWMGAGNKRPYEREFMQMIMRENNSEKAGNLSDYFIIDMEHQYEKGGAIPDLVGLIMERGKRQKPVFRLSIIEVKYLDSAFTGTAGIHSHIADYVQLINNSDMLSEVKHDISEMFYQSKRMGLLPGIKNKYDRIDISDERPELLLALVSRNTNNGKNNRQDDVESLKSILEKSLNEYGDMLNDVYVAGTAEMGFGLYSDRKSSIRSFLQQL
jgi:hypothetical protein